MIIQYAAKLLVPFLEFRAHALLRAGKRDKLDTRAAAVCRQLSAVVGDSRILWRIWGILPILQWMISLERSQPPSRALQTIERLQGWSMLAYYPLEHLYYLASKNVLPFKLQKRTLARISIWSCRFWAAYVLLQFLHLREDIKLLASREKALRSQEKGKPVAKEADSEVAAANGPPDDWRDVAARRAAIVTEAVVNTAYLPLTIHWSVDGGIFRNEAWTAVFGLLAGLASFKGGWEATRAAPLRK